MSYSVDLWVQFNNSGLNAQFDINWEVEIWLSWKFNLNI